MLSAIAKPFGILLMFLYNLVKNYGVAIILFAIIIKIIMLPFQMKSKRGMMQTSRLAPRLKELEKKHGANKQKYNEEVQKLYREENIKPMSGCLWSILPLPIMLALFQAIRYPLTIMMGVPAALLEAGGAIAEKLTSLGFTQTASAAYVQIEQTQFISSHWNAFSGLSDKLQQMNFDFFGIDLSAVPQWNYLFKADWSSPDAWKGVILFLIPIISGALTFIQSKISAKMNTAPGQEPDQAQQQMKSMNFIMPLMSVYFAFIMPAAIGIYWAVGSVLAIVQDVWLTKRYTKIMDAEDIVKNEIRQKREAELEEKRKETERLKAEGKYVNPNVSKKKQLTAEKQAELERAAEWEKKNAPPKEDDPSRIGTRRYARGRAYVEDRFENPDAADEVEESDAEYAEDSGDDSMLLEAADTVENTDAQESDGAENAGDGDEGENTADSE